MRSVPEHRSIGIRLRGRHFIATTFTSTEYKPYEPIHVRHEFIWQTRPLGQPSNTA